MFCSFHCSITDHFITGEKTMTKTMNLQGVWDFQLDTGCTGIDEAFYTKNFDDTISLPGTTSMAQKGTFSDKMETGTPRRFIWNRRMWAGRSCSIWSVPA